MPELPHEKDCTGCGACANVCPVNAITMGASSNQFLIPKVDNACVNCGLCTKVCPSLHPSYTNEKEPKFYSFNADDATRAVSSSGGIFSVLAELFLSQGGYVCGSRFDDSMQCHHTIIDKIEDLPPLRGSKYVQSDMRDCYRQIKKLLTKGKKVLFCGTSCQVAGLYAVLGKDYDSLLTLDLLCHGVTSQQFLDKYLEGIANGKRVVDMQFRSKRLGWGFKGVIVTYDDGSEYVNKNQPKKKQAYEDAYIKNMMMRYSCFHCQFRTYPRQGDFTIGDLWHANTLDPESDDKKGTSFVFLNNTKAVRYLELIKDRTKYAKELPVADYTKLPNSVRPKANPHPYRRRFLDMIKTHSFQETYDMVRENHYDIGLPSVFGNYNIGSMLTYYALYHTLQELGYTVLPIERPLDSRLPVSEKTAQFTKKWLRPYEQPMQYPNLMEMRELNTLCDQFVVGSDQVFLEDFSEKRNHYFHLQWVDECKNKVGYACSFGGPMARGTEEYYRNLQYYLNRFSFLSSREDDGVRLMNEEIKVNKTAVWCIDPVFLPEKSIYQNLIAGVTVKRNKPFISAYIIIPRPSINLLLAKARKKFKDYDTELFGTASKCKDHRAFEGIKATEPFPLEQSLEKIHNCEFFLTDSFHGMCFAILFRKNFMVMPRDFVDRFQSLLSRIGLEDRIVKANHSNYSDKLYEPIDYDAVYEKLTVLIEESRNHLKNSLLPPRNATKPLSDMDILMQYIKSQNDRIDSLTNELTSLREALASLTDKE